MPNRLSWQDYFMANAELISKRSTCDRAFVGAVLVKDKRIIATKNTEIYVTHFPCINCTKALLQAGIVKITYKANYRPHPFAIELMEQKGVSYLQHDVPEVHLGMDD